jgi:hypothetical protein
MATPVASTAAVKKTVRQRAGQGSGLAALAAMIDARRDPRAAAVDAGHAGEIDVEAAVARPDDRRLRQGAVLLLKPSERGVAAVSRVDVHDERRAAGRDADVRVPVLPPPFAYLGRVGRRVPMACAAGYRGMLAA